MTKTGAPARKPVLGSRFRRLWSSSVASNAGDGVTRTLLPLLVVASHPQPMVVAGLTAVNMLPWLLFALPAGVLADRHDRRRILLVSNLTRAAALLAAVAAFAAGTSLAVLYVLSFVLGIAETLAETAAPAMLPDIVEPEHLEHANGRLFAPQIILNEMAGPPLAGLLVGVGATLALATGGALYGLAAVLLLGLAGVKAAPRTAPPPGTSAARSLWQDLRTGVSFVLTRAALTRTLAASALYGLVYSATFSMLVLLAHRTLHLHATGYGLLLTVGSVGSIAGTWLAPRLARRLPTLVLAQWSLILSGAAYVGLGLAGNTVLAGAAIFCNGLFMMSWNIPVLSLRQRFAPPELQGRVMSVSRLCSWGTMPIGAALGGLLARTTSVTTVFVSSGAVLILGSVALLAPLRQDVLTGEQPESSRVPHQPQHQHTDTERGEHDRGSV
ncbi:MFS transporter [Streptomyces telluris]|uniref:MFS transporter n=1 Tax=Streptomyces telluris TaxID=2720021 RepID=A0A9X2RNG7_9ACTN|nr:MFS transporter [Streptomyces telluris]MCQ8770401.1 MFS transporter [Streptomyces telluris]NJP81058.1 MFS transporter [Streptomyces telluris]